MYLLACLTVNYCITQSEVQMTSVFAKQKVKKKKKDQSLPLDNALH